MNMAALQADMRDSYAPAPRDRERCGADRSIHRSSPQAANARFDTHHDMLRMRGAEVRPPLVPTARARLRGLASRATPLASSPPALKQLLLDRRIAS